MGRGMVSLYNSGSFLPAFDFLGPSCYHLRAAVRGQRPADPPGTGCTDWQPGTGKRI